MTSSEGGEQKKPIWKSPWVWGFIIGAVALTAIRPLQDAMLTAPPPLATVGEWTLVDQSGAPFGTEQLQGKVWVADYFFTRCPSICPELTKTLQKVQQTLGPKYGDKMHFVSFTVDPEHDTPDKLAAYAKRYGVDTAQWTFVTGELDAVHELIRKRMFLHIGEKTPMNPAAAAEAAADGGQAPVDQAALFDISHLGKFVLFDQRGDLRATFTADEGGMAALGNAARLLIVKGPDA